MPDVPAKRKSVIKDCVVGVRVDPHVRARLDELSRRNYRSLAAEVRIAVDQYLERNPAPVTSDGNPPAAA